VIDDTPTRALTERRDIERAQLEQELTICPAQVVGAGWYPSAGALVQSATSVWPAAHGGPFAWQVQLPTPSLQQRQGPLASGTLLHTLVVGALCCQKKLQEQELENELHAHCCDR
jgi:hypothetical protein